MQLWPAGPLYADSETANRRISNRRTAEGRCEDLESKVFTFAFCGSTFDILRFSVSAWCHASALLLLKHVFVVSSIFLP
jgi:hypothetical protein